MENEPLPLPDEEVLPEEPDVPPYFPNAKIVYFTLSEDSKDVLEGAW